MQSWDERSKDAMIGENPFGNGEVDLDTFANLEGLTISVGGEVPELDGMEPKLEE